MKVPFIRPGIGKHEKIKSMQYGELLEYLFLVDGQEVTATLSYSKYSAVTSLKRRNAHNLRKNWSIVVVRESKMNQPGFKIKEHEIPLTDPHFV